MAMSNIEQRNKSLRKMDADRGWEVAEEFMNSTVYLTTSGEYFARIHCENHLDRCAIAKP